MLLPALSAALVFQFTHPGGVRLSPVTSWIADVMRFNSRTREGCDTLDIR